MFRVSLKGALAKKLRLFSTALSVMLGVAFLAGTLVFTDTIRRTFDNLFANIYENTDSYVRSSTSVDMAMGFSQRGRMSEELLATVARVDGVAETSAQVAGYAQLVDATGKAVGNPGQGAPTLGMSYSEGQLSPWTLTEGSRAPGPDEVVIDKGSAKRAHLHIGDTVTVLSQTGPHKFLIVGIALFGTSDSPGGASAALFDLPTAQHVLVGHTGEVDAIAVKAEPGVSQEQLTARIAKVLPPAIEALTGSEITKENQDSIQKGLGFISTFLLVFAAIGFVVACFTIFNTFQIIVTQRSREMALLRAIGATRRQVLSAQLVEAALVGLIASLVGLVVGVGVAGALKGMLAAFGVDIPAGGTVLMARTAVVALLVGMVVTVGSAVLPSMRASRVPPIAAVRDVAVDHTGQSRRRLLSGGVVLVLGIAAFVTGLIGSGIQWVGIGALLSFVGVFMLTPLIAGPSTKLLGAPLPALAGITGSLAVENAVRNPKRTARTGGALMVGVALVAAITVIAASVKDWTHDIVSEQFTGDFVVATNTFGFGGLSPALADALNALPEVDTATGIRIGGFQNVSGGGGDTSYMAVDPSTAGRLFDLGMIEGSIEALTPQGILIDDSVARDRGLHVGRKLDFRFLDGTLRRLTVNGIYTKQELAGKFVISHALHEQSGADQFDFSVYVTKAAGVSDADARAAIARVSDAYPNADLQSRTEYIKAQGSQIDPLVNLMYGLLGLAVIIALLNIANSMSLSIYERTRELGLLRAVGMTRRQTRKLVRLESVLVALLGSGLGVVLGVFFGWSISVTIRDQGLGAFQVPVLSLIVVVGIAVFGTLLAAMRPARRAARLDVLRAIATG